MAEQFLIRINDRNFQNLFVKIYQDILLPVTIFARTTVLIYFVFFSNAVKDSKKTGKNWKISFQNRYLVALEFLSFDQVHPRTRNVFYYFCWLPRCFPRQNITLHFHTNSVFVESTLFRLNIKWKISRYNISVIYVLYRTHYDAKWLLLRFYIKAKTKFNIIRFSRVYSFNFFSQTPVVFTFCLFIFFFFREQFIMVSCKYLHNICFKVPIIMYGNGIVFNFYHHKGEYFLRFPLF